VPGADPAAVGQGVGRPAPRQLGHSQLVDADPLLDHGLQHRIAEAALLVVILHRDEPAVARAAASKASRSRGLTE